MFDLFKRKSKEHFNKKESIEYNLSNFDSLLKLNNENLRMILNSISDKSIFFDKIESRLLYKDELERFEKEYKCDLNGLIPLIDISNNDFIVYICESDTFGIFNIVDEIIVDKNIDINEWIERINIEKNNEAQNNSNIKNRLFDIGDLKKENFNLEEYGYEFLSYKFNLVINKEIFDDDTIEYAKKIVNKYVNEKENILNHMLNARLRDFYKKNYNHSDEYIKNQLGKPQIKIDLKKDESHPNWKFEYAGIIDFCESRLDEHIVSIEFRDELVLDKTVQLNG